MNKFHKLFASRVFQYISVIVVAGLLVSAFSASWVRAATPAFVQARAKEISSGAVNSQSFTSANAAGNLIVVSVLWNNTNSVAVTDSRGNTYAAATARTTWGSNWSAQTFYAKNIAAGANTVSATFATSINSFGIIQLHEYAGIDKLNPFDGASAAAGTGQALNSGPITTTAGGDLLFGAGGSAGSMSSLGAGYTQRLNTSGNKTMDKLATAPGSYNATASHGGGKWVMQVAAFKADAGADTTAPTIPLGLQANAVSSTQINLSWAASTDNVGVTGYQIERCQGAGCTTFSLLTTVTGTSHANSTLAPSTLYRYRVRAADAAGNFSGYSNIAEATTQGVPDTTPPSVPTGLNGTGTSISTINLSWTASTDNIGVTGYKVFRNGVQVGTSPITSFQDTGLNVDTSYSYSVSAFDAAANNSAQTAPVSVSTLPDTTPPSVPANLTATPMTPSQITINWNTSADNVGVAGYKLYRDGIFVTDTTVKPIQDTGLTPGTTYNYSVSAFDAAGNESAQTAAVAATTPTPDTQPPAASMTAPAHGAAVSGTIAVSANATDNVGVTDVEFLLDGVSIGVDATAPYSVQWDTTTTSNGQHGLSARARDTAGNFGLTSGVVTILVDNSATPPLPAGLVAGYNFNESTGSTTADVTGNGNTALLAGGALWAAGKNGTGLSLDGSNDFLEIANSPTVNLSGTAMSFSAWIFPRAGGGDQLVFAKGYNGSMVSPYYQYAMELRGGGVWPTFLIGTASGLKEASMGSNLPAGQWSHLAIVFNGTQAVFYLNGNLMSTPALAASLEQRETPLRLGADAQPGQFLNGSLDDVRLYNRALNQTEVQTDMNTPLASPAADPNAPVVTIVSPAGNAQVGGIVTIAADATDDTGIAGVQFYVDGIAVGPEDTVEPYGAVWDTRTFANGAHTLTARARDVSGNTTVSPPVTVNAVNSDSFQNEILATGFNLPVVAKFLPNGNLLVGELNGKIKVVPPPYTSVSPTLFNQLVISPSGVQQGLYDLTLDPNFTVNRYYYVFYTAETPNLGFDRLSRFTATADLSGTVPGSEVVLYQDPGHPGNEEHHGGGIAISNDGHIFFTTGEGFNAALAQNLSSPRGKLHRINMDGSVPADNPFYDGAGPNFDSIWAYGLRNPFRAHYDTFTNRVLIGDVGGNVGTSNEEINVGVRGADYGWPNFEGNCPAPCTSPLYTYEHNNRDASITGGFIYKGTQFPSGMQGNYFFADYSQNWIKRISFNADGSVGGVFNLEPANGQVDGPYGDIVSLTEGPDGALYYLDLGYTDTTGTFGVSKVRRIKYLSANQAPVVVASANPATGSLPLNVAFSSAGSSDPEGQPLTYSWDFGDGTPLSAAANPAHTYTAAGQYTVRLTVSDGVNSSFSTPLVIQAGSAPVSTIAAPLDGATFRAGDVITYSGDATDEEDGTLPASAFTWTVDFLHEGHVHPGSPVTNTKVGSFTIPTSGHDFSGNTRYRITLTVTDSNGLTNTKSVTVWPEKVNLTFNTEPANGLTLYLDGIAKTAPFTYDTLVGFTHSIEARNQTVGNTSYTFDAWSDGGAQTHTVLVPATAQTYTSAFTATQLPVTGLMGAWGFNEAGGTAAADSSGNSNTATLVNGPTRVAGKYGNGLSFDHVNDYLNIPNSSSLDIAGSALTLSTWLNPTSMSGDSMLLAKFWNNTWTAPYFQYGIELHSNGSKPVFFVGTTGGYLSVPMDTTLPYNTWSHLAITFNGSQVLFYVNGNLVSTKTMNAVLTARGQRVHAGADGGPGQYYFGRLDDLRIYNRVQTPSEIQSDMNTGL